MRAQRPQAYAHSCTFMFMFYHYDDERHKIVVHKTIPNLQDQDQYRSVQDQEQDHSVQDFKTSRPRPIFWS